MTGNLDQAIQSLLTAALPDLFGGAAPPVTLAVLGEQFVVDPAATPGAPSEPRPDDQIDEFAFDPTGLVFDPQAPNYDPAALPTFTLSKPPYPGPRRVRLTTASGDRIVLKPAEVLWDEQETRRFTLIPLPSRALAGVNGVQVLYSVIAVFTTLKLNPTLAVQLEAGDPGQLERAAALTTGIIELNRQTLIDEAAARYTGGDYSAAVTVKTLTLLEGSSPAADQRHLRYQAEVELKTVRALRSDEGRPIVRIRTPGRPVDPDRPIDIEVRVDA
jgi:hypothetical protein